jgi:hypothetical protein
MRYEDEFFDAIYAVGFATACAKLGIDHAGSHCIPTNGFAGDFLR